MRKYIFLVLAFFSLNILFSCTPQEGNIEYTNTSEGISLTQESSNTQKLEAEKSGTETFIEVQEESIPEYLIIERDGNNLTFETILEENALYTRYQISYQSEGFKISGIMNIPKNIENAPLLILNHGYIDTSVYTLGRGLKREQDYFARNGFAVIHTDYRNHAFSDIDESLSGTGMILRSKKYGADAINAILAVQKAKAEGAGELQNIDSEKVGMLGHSMGGGVTMYGLVAANDLIDAAVLYAPVHSNEYYNYERWSSNRLSESQKEILTSEIGNLDEPQNFISLSPEGYFERIQAPVQIYFGTQDESCPVSWGSDIKNALELENKSVELIIYEGERHEFVPEWNNFMQGSADFFRKNLQ